MSLPIVLERQSDLSLQEQIYRFIRDKVLSGTYATGVRLPSTRDLALDLHVSRTTVLLGYEWLMSEGYIETRKGVGTFVCRVVSDAVGARHNSAHRTRTPAEALMAVPRPAIVVPRETPTLVNMDSERPSIDFWYGRPDPRQFPIKAWRRLITQKLATPNAGLAEYCGQAGDPQLRAAISQHISTTRGFLAGPERIVTAGTGLDQRGDRESWLRRGGSLVSQLWGQIAADPGGPGRDLGGSLARRRGEAGVYDALASIPDRRGDDARASPVLAGLGAGG
jgi:GntR family transcriptional regulator/MocR family aminotransferase